MLSPLKDVTPPLQGRWLELAVDALAVRAKAALAKSSRRVARNFLLENGSEVKVHLTELWERLTQTVRSVLYPVSQAIALQLASLSQTFRPREERKRQQLKRGRKLGRRRAARSKV